MPSCCVSTAANWDGIAGDSFMCLVGGQLMLACSKPLLPNALTEEIGPGGARALFTALLGADPSMTGKREKAEYDYAANPPNPPLEKEPNFKLITGGIPFRLVKEIVCSQARIGDEGGACIAEVLRLGGAEVAIGYLKIYECGLGPMGVAAIGSSLAAGLSPPLS